MAVTHYYDLEYPRCSAPPLSSTDHARRNIDEALSSKGINFDVKSIDSASMNELIDALADLEVDVFDGTQHVRVYAE